MDAILISQVFINLLENAIKFSTQNTEVRFSLHEYNDFARFEVSDKGDGIPMEIVDQLFNATSPNQRQSSDSVSGMGIGLSICKTIIDAHNGNITGENMPEGGAVFNIILPLKE